MTSLQLLTEATWNSLRETIWDNWFGLIWGKWHGLRMKLSLMVGYEIHECSWEETSYEPDGRWLYPDGSIHLETPSLISILKQAFANRRREWYFTRVNDAPKMSRVDKEGKCIEIRELRWWERLLRREER